MLFISGPVNSMSNLCSAACGDLSNHTASANSFTGDRVYWETKSSRSARTLASFATDCQSICVSPAIDLKNTTNSIGFPRSPFACCFLKAFEGVGKFANEEDQRGGLRIGYGAALLLLLESSQVDAKLACEHGS